MKDKKLTNNYDALSLEELTFEANEIIQDLENRKDLEGSVEKYQDLLKLNSIIEKKFQKSAKNINEKSKKNIIKIIEKKKCKKD